MTTKSVQNLMPKYKIIKNDEYFRFYSDLHYFGVDPYYKNGETLEINDDTFFTGDIFDRKNCKKEDMHICNDYLYELHRIMKGKYLTGNHECNRDFDEFYPITENAVCLHGDSLLYGKHKSLAVREVEPFNCGFLMRSLKLIGSKYRDINGFSAENCIKDENFLRNIIDFCYSTNIILGHTHIKNTEMHSTTIEGKTKQVWFLKRGLTIIRKSLLT